MSHRTPLTLFFAGTDTEIGKTYCAALVARSLHRRGKRVGVYKPVASDCHRDAEGQLIAEDALALWEAAGKPLTLAEVCPQRFVAPLAPPAAAALEGSEVDPALLRSGAEVWETGFDVLIVEGAGGLFSPLADGLLNIDLARNFEPTALVIVAADRLGVIHQVLATCTAATHCGLEPRGIFLNQCAPQSDTSTATNRSQLERYCDIPVLDMVPHDASDTDTSWVDRLSL